MKISIIHLSDIHLKTDDDIILDRINKIPNILNDLKLSSDYIFFVVTGDIVFRGNVLMKLLIMQKKYQIKKLFVL